MSTMLTAALLAFVQPGVGAPDPHGPPGDPTYAWARCVARSATPLVMQGSRARRAVRRAERDCAPLEAEMAAGIQRSEQAAGRTVDKPQANRMAQDRRTEVLTAMIPMLESVRESMRRR